MSKAKIKVSELFSSIQGEGRYAGVPSIFLRSFGCNFRCKSFGLTHGTKFDGPNPEVQQIINDIEKYRGKKFTELPLVNTGCDTYAAVYPEFKDFSPMMSVYEITDKIEELLDVKVFSRDFHLILTGGEPLLPGWQKAYSELIDQIHDRGLAESLYITVETNGTQILGENVFDKTKANMHFSVSPKLMASGESIEDAIKPEAIESYLKVGEVDLKFVVDDEESVLEVIDVMMTGYENIPFDRVSVYLMPEGGTNEAYAKNQRKVADLAMKYGFRFSPRLQCIIYGNEWNT